MKFRKKPVEVEAFQMTQARRWDNSEWPNWLNLAWNTEKEEAGSLHIVDTCESGELLAITTLEGVHGVSWDDYIIQGVKGELYCCKSDIFDMTYDEVKAVPLDTYPSPYGEPEPKRYRLPVTRKGPTVKFTLTEDGIDEEGQPTIVKVDGYFTVNTYADGMPGEIWITIDNPGYSIQGFANCWAIAMSMLLQFGVPPQKLYDKFKAREFQPNGISQVASVPFTKSMVDLIMRWMELNMAPTARPTTPEDVNWMKSVEEVVN